MRFKKQVWHNNISDYPNKTQKQGNVPTQARCSGVWRVAQPAKQLVVGPKVLEEAKKRRSEQLRAWWAHAGYPTLATRQPLCRRNFPLRASKTAKMRIEADMTDYWEAKRTSGTWRWPTAQIRGE